MAREISFARLEELLTKVGFQTLPTAGKHQVFKEPVSEAMVVLPAYPKQAQVRPIHLVAVRRTLVENGLIDEDVFDKITNQIPELVSKNK
ncbi:MAG: type II toxin-antitoxin system HicA family toxin [Oscillatoria sp. SIO1A7]|nr:type II toxin-antitoxin system HicA family toxin [Oscillatoria sp. SIO1A7]